MKITKLLKNNVAIKDGDEYAVIQTNPLRLITITEKQYNIAISVATLLSEASNDIQK